MDVSRAPKVLYISTIIDIYEQPCTKEALCEEIYLLWYIGLGLLRYALRRAYREFTYSFFS